MLDVTSCTHQLQFQSFLQVFLCCFSQSVSISHGILRPSMASKASVILILENYCRLLLCWIDNHFNLCLGLTCFILFFTSCWTRLYRVRWLRSKMVMTWVVFELAINEKDESYNVAINYDWVMLKNSDILYWCLGWQKVLRV
jgi:hypothetical protein